MQISYSKTLISIILSLMTASSASAEDDKAILKATLYEKGITAVYLGNAIAARNAATASSAGCP